MTNYENLILELATQELEKMRGGILNGLKVTKKLSNFYESIITILLSDAFHQTSEARYSTDNSMSLTFQRDATTGVVFRLSHKVYAGLSGATQNSVMTIKTANEQGYSLGTVITEDFIRARQTIFERIVSEYELGSVSLTNLLVIDYADIITAYQDAITEFINMEFRQHGGLSPLIDNFLSGGILEFGGIKFHPTFDNNRIFYRMDLSEKIRNHLKSDTRYTSDDEDRLL